MIDRVGRGEVENEGVFFKKKYTFACVWVTFEEGELSMTMVFTE